MLWFLISNFFTGGSSIGLTHSFYKHVEGLNASVRTMANERRLCRLGGFVLLNAFDSSVLLNPIVIPLGFRTEYHTEDILARQQKNKRVCGVCMFSMLKVKKDAMIIIHACTVTIVHACIMIRVNTCSLIIGYVDAMIVIHVPMYYALTGTRYDHSISFVV